MFPIVIAILGVLAVISLLGYLQLKNRQVDTDDEKRRDAEK